MSKYACVITRLFARTDQRHCHLDDGDRLVSQFVPHQSRPRLSHQLFLHGGDQDCYPGARARTRTHERVTIR